MVFLEVTVCMEVTLQVSITLSMFIIYSYLKTRVYDHFIYYTSNDINTLKGKQ